jgi:hypothetical protein
MQGKKKQGLPQKKEQEDGVAVCRDVNDAIVVHVQHARGLDCRRMDEETRLLGSTVRWTLGGETVALSALRRLPPAPFGFRFVVRAGGGRGVSAFVSRERLAERPGRPRLVGAAAAVRTSLLLLADCEASKGHR